MTMKGQTKICFEHLAVCAHTVETEKMHFEKLTLRSVTRHSKTRVQENLALRVFQYPLKMRFSTANGTVKN